MGSSNTLEEHQPHCPWCGRPMRSLSTHGQFYCLSDNCRTQFVKITTREEWTAKRREKEAKRQRELAIATKVGLGYPSIEATAYLKEHPIEA